jgi:hypothetical protein
MRIRSVLQEYQARLRPTTSAASSAPGSGHGNAEWKVYADGTRRCKVWVSGLDLSDGAVLQLSVSGGQLAEMLVRHGRARYRRESERGEAVPAVELDQVLQISYAGMVILEGSFYPD